MVYQRTTAGLENALAAVGDGGQHIAQVVRELIAGGAAKTGPVAARPGGRISILVGCFLYENVFA